MKLTFEQQVALAYLRKFLENNALDLLDLERNVVCLPLKDLTKEQLTHLNEVYKRLGWMRTLPSRFGIGIEDLPKVIKHLQEVLNA